MEGVGNGGALAQDVPLLGPDAAQATQAGLTRAGVLCVLCGMPTGPMTPRDEPHPLEYLRLDTTLEEGKVKPTIVTSRIVVCGRAGCHHQELRKTADAVRPFTGWEIIDQEEEERVAEAKKEMQPHFRKGQPVVVREDRRGGIIMSCSRHEPTEDHPKGYWQYAVSTDGTSVNALEGNPFREDQLEAAPEESAEEPEA